MAAGAGMSTRLLYLESGNPRQTIAINEADSLAFAQLPPRSGRKSITVTDQDTGLKWSVHRASCGLNCFCAAAGTMLDSA